VDDIREMIQKGYIGTRTHEGLTAMGFNGSLSTVHRLIKGIKNGESYRIKDKLRRGGNKT